MKTWYHLFTEHLTASRGTFYFLLIFFKMIHSAAVWFGVMLFSVSSPYIISSYFVKSLIRNLYKSSCLVSWQSITWTMNDVVNQYLCLNVADVFVPLHFFSPAQDPLSIKKHLGCICDELASWSSCFLSKTFYFLNLTNPKLLNSSTLYVFLWRCKSSWRLIKGFLLVPQISVLVSRVKH